MNYDPEEYNFSIFEPGYPKRIFYKHIVPKRIYYDPNNNIIGLPSITIRIF